MTKSSKQPAASAPTTHDKILARQRENARKALLKRRRRKSHQ